MPPILVAFFLLLGGLTAPDLVKGLDPRPDRSSRSKFGKPAPVEYRTWTSRPWVAVSDDQTRVCSVTYFALATRNAVVRLEAGGAEQLLDSSWSFPRELKEKERRTLAFNFRDPQSGESLSCQEQTVVCYSSRAMSLEAEDVREGRCAPDARIPGKKGEKAALVGQAPPFRMYDPAVGGAFIDVAFEIRGPVPESWYCPKIEVEWPDGARTSRESDCDPFPGPPDQRFRWTFNHGFPGGEWDVKACISKSGRQLACTVVKVRVMGDSPSTPFMGDGR